MTVLKPIPLLDENVSSFRIKGYYKYELAALYGIGVNTLAAYMKSIEKELEKANYRKYQKWLYPVHVEIIVSYLGEP